MTSAAVADRWEGAIESRWATPVAVTALCILSLYLRMRVLNAGFWIDEGISVGLAHHHWSSIPSLLKQDGSPPAYYMLLGLWIRVFGDGESATHTLSLLFALGYLLVLRFVLFVPITVAGFCVYIARHARRRG